MGKTLYFYNDAALTVPLFSLPFGSITSTYTLADMVSFTDGDKTCYYYIGNQNKFSYPTIEGVSMSGKNYNGVYTDGFYTNYIRDSGNNNIQWARFYHNLQPINSGSGGSPQPLIKLAAVEFTVQSVPFIALGFPNNTQFIACLIVSANILGDKATNHQGGPDTPPGGGADAGAGWGSYDYTSGNAQGSAIPGTPSLPVSPDGHGLHAYTMSPEAYQVLGNALWGIGDAGNNIAFGDMWQKWKNYKFNPTAGILSCIRLPSLFTPSRTGISDTNIKISGTWAVAGGQFSSITGCKPADVSPIAQTVLSIDIPEQFGSWLDYDGGMEITLDLPFCGRMQIDPNACVNGGIDVVYRCDPCNGNVCAFVYCRDRWGNNQLYNAAYGNCAFQVPLTGHDDGQVQMLGSFVSSAAALAGAAASPVMAAGAAVGAVSSMLMRREITQTVGSPAGSVSYVGNVTPTLIISKAHAVKSPGTIYDDTEGRPCEYGGSIGDYTGFNIFHNIDVQISGASAEECAEIERLLESGVIL